VLFPNLALSLLSVEALISDVTLRAVHFDFLIAEEARRLFHGKVFATQSSSSESGTPQKGSKNINNSVSVYAIQTEFLQNDLLRSAKLDPSRIKAVPEDVRSFFPFFLGIFCCFSPMSVFLRDT